MARKSNPALPKLTDPELDLLAHLDEGYQLETDSLGGNPVLGRFQGDEVVRPVNRNTIKAMRERGLITPAIGQHPLSIVWRLTKTAK